MHACLLSGLPESVAGPQALMPHVQGTDGPLQAHTRLCNLRSLEISQPLSLLSQARHAVQNSNQHTDPELPNAGISTITKDRQCPFMQLHASCYQCFHINSLQMRDISRPVLCFLPSSLDWLVTELMSIMQVNPPGIQVF